MASLVTQGKYFLIEEAQAMQTANELGVEMGFALHNIELPMSKQKNPQMNRIRNLFRPSSSSRMSHRPSDAASDAGSASSVPNSSSSVWGGGGGGGASVVGGGARNAKYIVPICVLQVYCKPEVSVSPSPSPASSSTTSPDASSQDWQLVYQSDAKKISNHEPITLNALLLLPLPSIILSKRQVLMDRPIRFEVWAGQRKTDTLVGLFQGLLGQLLSEVGSPKRFPNSPTMTSYWDEVDLDNVEALHSNAKLAIRVGFPDRLISVSVPHSVHEVEVSEWRPAPFFAGPTLRGLTYNPVSKAFQAGVAMHATNSGGEENAGLMSETAHMKRSTRGTLGTNLIEFREEMAEMPLNLLLPACYLKLAGTELGERCDLYTQKFHRDLGLIKKLATSDFALTVSDFTAPKYVEAMQRLEKFALDLTNQGRERMGEMKEASLFYQEQWVAMVTSGGGGGGGGGGGPKSKSTSLSPNKKKTTLKLLGEDILAKSSSVDAFAEQEGEEEQDEDAVEIELRKQYVEELNLADSPGEPLSPSSSSAVCSFRKSTSRKDRRLRFMPINMHLQVLTVRETVVRPKVVEKPVAAAVAPPTIGQGIVGRLKSIRRMTVDAALLGGGSAGPLSRKSMATSFSNNVRSSDNNNPTPPVSPVPLNASSSMRRGVLSAEDMDEEDEDVTLREETFFYDTLSAGAPAAHALTSKYGGCWQQVKEVTKLREEFKRLRDDPKYDIFARLDSFRKFKEMEWILGERVDVCLPQALSIMAGAVLGRIYVMAAEFSSSVVGGFGAPDDEVAQSLITHGFLIGWESLLSTHGKEMAMLGDLFYCVRYFNEHMLIRFEVGNAEGEEEEAAARGGGVVEMVADGESGGEEEDEDGERVLLKDSLNVRLFKTTLHKDQSNGYDAADRFLGPGGSDDGAVWLLVARIPSAVVEKLPKVVRTYIESHSASLFDHVGKVELDQLSPAPLKWTCVLFTQGINEMQNVANLMGNNRALQEEINEFSCTKLVEYCVRRFEAPPEATKKTRKSLKVLESSGGNSAASQTREAMLKEEERHRRAKLAYQQSLMWAAKLRISVSNQSQAGKSFEILQHSADLVRWLSGVRIASCKSAKDRTAMSLTWEEARILHNVHYVRDMPLLDLANLFREHGTRLINVHKNTGMPRYAFNKAQRSFLPESYRPPMSTIGSLFGTNLS